MLIYLNSYKSIQIKTTDLRFLLCFLLVPIYGIIVMPLNVIVYGNTYLSFGGRTIGRIINTCTNVSLFFLIASYLNKDNCNFELIMRAYIAGCLVLIIFGLWQLAHNFFGIPYPNFQTRSHLHSIGSSELEVTGRITSIAEEPSYLVPYLLESFILIYFSKCKYKKVWIFFTVITLVFTLSLSAYMNVCILLCYLFFSSRLTRKKVIIFCIALVSIVLLFYLVSPILIQVFSRMRFSSLLQSERLQQIYLPLIKQFQDMNYWGYGPKGYDFVADLIEYAAGWREGQVLGDSSTTSHVLFVDFLLEYGLLGVLLLLFLFIPLFKKTFLLYRFQGCKVPHIFLVNYLISNLFVVDYASPHCLIVFSIIMYYMKLETREKRNLSLNSTFDAK